MFNIIEGYFSPYRMYVSYSTYVQQRLVLKCIVSQYVEEQYEEEQCHEEAVYEEVSLVLRLWWHCIDIVGNFS